MDVIEPIIQKQIHQVFINKDNPTARPRWSQRRAIKRLQDTNPDFAHTLWNGQAVLDLFNLPEYARFKTTYLSIQDSTAMSEFARMMILYNQGGIYLDIDMDATKPMNEILSAYPTRRIMLVRESEIDPLKMNRIANCFVAVEKGFPLMFSCLETMESSIRALNGVPVGDPVKTTGPIFLYNWLTTTLDLSDLEINMYTIPAPVVMGVRRIPMFHDQPDCPIGSWLHLGIRWWAMYLFIFVVLAILIAVGTFIAKKLYFDNPRVSRTRCPK